MHSITTTASFAPGKLTSAILAETRATPLQVPSLKTPLMERAKSSGATHREALAWTRHVLTRMRKRADAVTAKSNAKEAKQKNFIDRTITAMNALHDTQTAVMEPASDATIVNALKNASIKTDKVTIKLAGGLLLRAQIRKAFINHYRTCANGSVTTTLAKSHSAIEQSEHTDWNLYRGKYKGWAAHILDTKLTIRLDYWSAVQAKIGSVIDGILLLNAAPIRAKGIPAGTRAFEVEWIAQGRGNAVRTVAGFAVVRGDGKRVLADDLETAVKSARVDS